MQEKPWWELRSLIMQILFSLLLNTIISVLSLFICSKHCHSEGGFMVAVAVLVHGGVCQKWCYFRWCALHFAVILAGHTPPNFCNLAHALYRHLSLQEHRDSPMAQNLCRDNNATIGNDKTLMWFTNNVTLCCLPSSGLDAIFSCQRCLTFRRRLQLVKCASSVGIKGYGAVLTSLLSSAIINP